MSDDPEILRKAKALDEMERSVNSTEADVLERVLEAFEEKKNPKITDARKIEAMYTKYLEPREEEGGNAASGEENGEYPVDEELDF